MKKHIKQLFLDFKIFFFMGPIVSFYCFLSDFIIRNKFFNKKIVLKYETKKNNTIKKFLKRKFKNFINDYKLSFNNKNISNECKIWVYWDSGIDNAPKIIKKCINSIVRNKERHEVIILDDKNLNKYINLDNRIIKLIKKNKICKANFADIIRIELLKRYGGIWMDASIFLVKIPKEIYDYNFYSIKHMKFDENTHICKGYWTSFFLASNENNCLITFVSDFIKKYLEKYHFFASYFLIDIVFSIAYESFYECRKIIDDLPVSNFNVFNLAIALEKNEKLEKNDYQFVNKLSYKTNIDINKIHFYN